MNTKTIARFIAVGSISLMAFAQGAVPALANTAPVTVDSPAHAQMGIPRGFSGEAVVGARHGVNVRACAGMGCKIVKKLAFGRSVNVSYTRGGWANVGKGMWIANYLLVADR